MGSFWLLIIFLVLFSLNIYIIKCHSLSNINYDIYFEEKTLYEGEKIHIIEKIYNGKLLPLPWVKSEFEISSNFLMDDGKNYVIRDKLRYTSIFFLLPFQQIIRKHSFIATKRGFYKLDKVFLVTGDLFGLTTSDKVFYFNSSVVVYPQIININNYVKPRSSLIGETIVKRFLVEDNFHFAGIREYQTYDSFNRINWNYSAKSGTLLVNKYEYTSSGDAIIILNVQSNEFERKDVLDKSVIEFGIKVCASLAKDLIQSGISVGFATNAKNEETQEAIDYIFPSRESLQIIKIFEILARIKIEITEYIETLFYNILKTQSYKEVVLITCFINKEIEEYIRIFSQKGIRFTILLLKYYDKKEIELPYTNIYYLSEK
ncbi:DUF58 domain-containing protein [Caldicellulosiruptoraceae bacterium PP1]